jgi:hypothetical protein
VGRVLIPVARAERLISFAVLSFVVSEAAGRFRRYDHAIVSTRTLPSCYAGSAPALLSAAPDGSAWCVLAC